MVRETLNKLTVLQREEVERYRYRYADARTSDYFNEKEVNCEMWGYVKGLRDSGLITDYESRVIHVYMTIKPWRRDETVINK